jgi:glycogen(starch) synthase
MMTPGDFASLQEGMEGLSTEDYIAWKLPEEEDPDEYPFPLTLRAKRGSNAGSAQMDGADETSPGLNGSGGISKGGSSNGLLESVNRS